MNYEDNVGVIKGIGEKTEKLLNRLGVFTTGDLIEYFPRDYDIFEPICPINTLHPDMNVTIEGFVTDSIQLKKVRKLTILSCRIQDASDSIMVTWFNMPYMKSYLKIGSRYILRGKVIRKNSHLVIEQPKLLSKEEYYKSLNTMTPIYPLTAGITSLTIAKAVRAVFGELEIDKDYLPSTIRKKYNLCEYKKAIKTIHFPKNNEDMLEARRRLVFDEFFIFTVALNRLKEEKHKDENKYIININSKICSKLIEKQPYTLTNAQLRTLDEIKKDMSGRYVMNRLVQGDVGSGKTIVAILALALIAEKGYQGVMMAPTEVLATQHYETIKAMLEDEGIKTGLLVGSMTAKEKKIVYEQIKNHDIDIIIGTHALIQDNVEYYRLGLVITDEQHRFGVRQRETLASKGDKPHVLVMSATPIPRTLAIIMYGDLDISIIDELPANRIPIKNCVVNTSYRNTAYTFISKQVAEGRQVYIICPMVEESETIEAENIIDYVEMLKMELPPFIQVEGLHGKMKAKEKNDIMNRFAKNEINVLVSTTVIEVGVNVPNATVMMVENSERFGLAQLHQLRGRVGRGGYQSYCIFMSSNESKEIMQRLEILNKSNDGFFIAGEDLRLRGPGDFFGVRQSGDMSFKIGDIFNDAGLLKEANDAAKDILIEDIKIIVKENSWISKKITNYAGTTVL